MKYRVSFTDNYLHEPRVYTTKDITEDRVKHIKRMLERAGYSAWYTPIAGMMCAVCNGLARYDEATNAYYHDIGFPQLETEIKEIKPAELQSI